MTAPKAIVIGGGIGGLAAAAGLGKLRLLRPVKRSVSRYSVELREEKNG
jgi:hypothetical protein